MTKKATAKKATAKKATAKKATAKKATAKNLFNGSFDRRGQILDRYNLLKNPFRKDAPPPDVLDKIFIARQTELRRAGYVMYDSPRNVLVRGGFGMGKTTFVRKLLSELAGAEKVRFLTVYHPLLGRTPLDFQNTAVKALAMGMRADDAQAEQVVHRLLSNERFDHPEIVLGELLGRANQRYTRVVIGIDELDKYPPREMNDVIVQSRPLLDMECSFVLTGTLLAAASAVDSSAYGAFQTIIELEPFSKEGSWEIILRNLQTFRVHETTDGLAPFEPAIVDRVVRDAAGIPGPSMPSASTCSTRPSSARSTGASRSASTSASTTSASRRWARRSTPPAAARSVTS